MNSDVEVTEEITIPSGPQRLLLTGGPDDDGVQYNMLHVDQGGHVYLAERDWKRLETMVKRVVDAALANMLQEMRSGMDEG